MQNYQNFIDELFRLIIDTTQYFVVDGQVLYDHLPEYYPAETPTDRLPGHVATFMSLDRYDQHQTENRYNDTLVELQRRAITDLLLLEPAQINRILSDAKSNCERLTQLLKKAIEYQKAWHFDRLDLLPAGFLNLQLLDVFTIRNRPEASPHARFTHHLTDAIMYKRGILSAFIKQIDKTLQSSPLILSNTPHEPEFDLWYVNNDDAYAFAKLKELSCYLPNIELFTERVEYFFKISRIWEIEPGIMGAGTRVIPDPKTFSHITTDGEQVDKNGQLVDRVAWGLNYKNDEEKAILHKLYFLRFYRTHRAYYLNKPRLDFDHLLQQYSNQRQTERGRRLQWEWVTGEILDRQQIINDWISANTDRYGKPEMIRQLQNAAVLIEQELEGIPAIKWELFYRPLLLDPLAFLWGLIEYKRFLETEEIPDPTTTTSVSQETQKPINDPFSDVQQRQYIRSILAPLSGLNPSNQAIMSRVDFDRLLTYTDHLVLTNTLPDEILPIAQTGISNEHIRFTFYQLHKQLFGTRKKRPTFIDFIHTVFAQFNGTAKTTTNSKFSTPPKSYKNDFAGYIGEVS